MDAISMFVVGTSVVDTNRQRALEEKMVKAYARDGMRGVYELEDAQLPEGEIKDLVRLTRRQYQIAAELLDEALEYYQEKDEEKETASLE